jgi:hypothetical protein
VYVPDPLKDVTRPETELHPNLTPRSIASSSEQPASAVIYGLSSYPARPATSLPTGMKQGPPGGTPTRLGCFVRSRRRRKQRRRPEPKFGGEAMSSFSPG